ncbi:MAG: hypothetical protein J6589_07600 [Snodgrassella sp.]|uniref:hypothetical protein n=1 Tax=Snodgrassella sp. TaxID=2815304 RepID=UPI00258E8465|nr:hypothetical protein [Snodgrassella sp.]MCO6514315.1 hypothetical protein [Snodgrassella sp.]MCO6520534.1 hypothetical protein [Snodgrassella sp.]
MTTCVDFKQECLVSLGRFAVKAKEGERKEILAVVKRLADELEAATDGLLNACMPAGIGAYDFEGYNYFWISLKNVETEGRQDLVQFETKFGGYPVRISYLHDFKSRTNFTDVAKNRENLEDSLAKMLHSPVIAEIIYSLMNEQRPVNGDEYD